MKEKILEIKDTALNKINLVTSQDELNNLRIQYLGKKGEMTSVLKQLGSLSNEERAETGKFSNIAKQEIEKAIEEKQIVLENAVYDSIKETEWIDISSPAKKDKSGRLHPITQIRCWINRRCCDRSYPRGGLVWQLQFVVLCAFRGSVRQCWHHHKWQPH